jgi:hypothetical protein
MCGSVGSWKPQSFGALDVTVSRSWRFERQTREIHPITKIRSSAITLLQRVRAGGGVAAEVAPGRGRGHRVLPALWAQRDRRAHVHAAAHVQGGRCRDQGLGMTLQDGGACANATAKDWLLRWPCRCCCCCCNLSRVHTNGGGPAISSWVLACAESEGPPQPAPAVRAAPHQGGHHQRGAGARRKQEVALLSHHPCQLLPPETASGHWCVQLPGDSSPVCSTHAAAAPAAAPGPARASSVSIVSNPALSAPCKPWRRPSRCATT